MLESLLSKRTIIFYTSLFFIVVSSFFISSVSFRYGVDFVGGFKLEYKILNNPSNVKISFDKINLYGDAKPTIIHTKDSIIIKLKKTDTDIKSLKDNIESYFNKNKIKTEVLSFDKISPKFGKELKERATISILLSLLLVLLYIFIRYEIVFAFSAILTLVHDLIITLAFLLLFNIEITTSIIAALLTIIGYSLNDTVIIFDRIRTILQKLKITDIKEISNISIQKNLSRTLLTSLTTLFTVCSLLVFGGESLYGFAFTLFVGIIIGTFSSMFIAPSLLEVFKFNTIKFKEKFALKMKNRKEKEELRNQFSNEGNEYY